MKLTFLDGAIIVAYLLLVVSMGFFVMKRAGKNLRAYFLGENTMPWWMLGVANASSMFDITGTMWSVYILFVYGLKGVWLPWMWPTFNQIFLMIYLAIWIRRSNVITGAEWITTRFGEGKGAELSRISVVVFALISVVGFLSYAFKGIGKFAAVFLPWSLSPDTYAVLFMGITLIYVMVGGMYSVVLTDLLQFGMMTLAAIFIGIIAIKQIDPLQVAAVVPQGWHDLFFGWHLNLDWSQILPAVNQRIAQDGWNLFTIVIMMMLFKGILISMAGPTPGYDMQRVLATRSPKESALMSGIVSVCLAPRWIMITGITLLALVFFLPQLQAMGPNIDFEMILPYVLNHFIPSGLLGLLLAGLLAAFMSTFDATVNAGASYIVNDIYKRYVNPSGTNRQYVKMSYWASILIVAVGIVAGLYAENINTAMQFIVSGLYGGYMAPNFLKWYWWRFNGYGYFWGMIAGIGAALVLPLLFPEITALFLFPFIFVFSLVVSIFASFLTQPDDIAVLKTFYRTVRPWGWWKPIHQLVVKESPQFKRNTAFKRDMLNAFVGIVWQLTLVLVPVYLVMEQWKNLAFSLTVLVLTSLFLKFNWYNKLEDN